MATTTAERFRLREVAKHYEVVASNSDVPDRRKARTASQDTSELLTPRPAKDKQLTALAQLATLRLGYKRCLVSIIDDSYQHFVAEATPSTNLLHQYSSIEHEDIRLGAQSVRLDQSLLPTACGNTQSIEGPDPAGETHVYGSDGVFYSDGRLLQILKSSSVKNVLAGDLYTYLEAPLTTDTGIILGSVCVIDSVQHAYKDSDLPTLRQLAGMIVDCLNTVRMKADHARAERLLQGLAHFVEGKESLSVWSTDARGQDFIPLISTQTQDLSSIHRSNSLHGRSAIRGTVNDSSIQSPFSQPPADHYSFDDMSEDYTPQTSMYPETISSPENNEARKMDTRPDPFVPDNSDEQGGATTRTTTTAAVAEAFARASNLIRECMNLEATCFLEVPHNDRARLVDNTNEPEDGSDLTSKKKSSGESDISSSSDAHTPGSTSRRSPIPDSICHRLAFSTQTKSSLARSLATTNFLNIPSSLLKSLASKYPRGRIFHFDNLGSVSSSEDGNSFGRTKNDGKDISNLTKKKKKTLSQKLYDLYPEAHSLVFAPLYDNDRQHIFAGFLGWTNSAYRALQPHEAIYVKGFVDSVMCEVMRLEAISTDKAKSDFIASISHEIRTPLHGILASAQLLLEGTKYQHQLEFISMVDVCGRTLLDIMDHLFDHAKINHFAERQRADKAKHKSIRRHGRETFSLVSQVNIAKIVEETAASVAASSHQLLQQRRLSSSGGDEDSPKPEKMSVPIIIDIDPHTNWTFPTEAGSWRRIIMNLIGNGLKYTAQGHIHVKLSLTDPKPNSRELFRRQTVVLKITDTGQGISAEYLKHRLFTAFAQEDNLSIGTGLGLNLVNQIVSSLKGRIEVSSEVGQGTEIQVRIPVVSANAVQPAGTSERSSTTEFAGLRISFAGFAQAPPPDAPTGILSAQSTAFLAAKQALQKMASEWFGMDVQATDAQADVNIVEKAYLEQHLDLYDLPRSRIMIVGIAGAAMMSLKHAQFVCVSPPIGPIRLTDAFRMLMAPKKVPLRLEENRLRPRMGSRSATVGDAPSSKPSFTPGFSGMPATQPDPQSLIADDPEPQPEGRTRSGSLLITTSIEESTGPQFVAPALTQSVVLLVDDNDINLRILETFVKRLKNFKCLTASNGKEAVDRYKASLEAGQAISTIFMDINMPIMNGFKATRAIRDYEQSRKIETRPAKIIALTGLGNEESQDQVEQCGCDMYLRKPVSLKRLQEILL